MRESLPFRPSHSALLLALISAAFAGQAMAAAGRVDFAAGATVAGADGRQRPLAKGIDLDKGDTIRTDAGGRAQIRFTDGSYVSLQPNTEFAIKDYNFEGKTDGNERGIFGLARGAMRTVTGLIGRVNRNRYQVATPTATIGIRGTGGLISIGSDGSTLVTGTSGIWTLTNPSGTIDVPAGVSGKAPAAPSQPPQQTTEKPSSGPTQPTTTTTPYAQADNRDASGASADVAAAKVLVSGSGYGGGVVFSVAGSPFISGGPNATLTFDSVGRLTNIISPTETFTLTSSGSHAEFGTDGILAWGRWIGLVDLVCTGCGPTTYGPNEGFHYVVGMPTPVLPTSGTATYNLIGSTSPTYVGGTTAPGTVTGGTFSVTFGPAQATVALNNFGIAMPDGRSYMLNGSTVTRLATFTFNPTVTGAGGACGACGCSSTVNALFSGANAERIGAAYHINDSTGPNVLGAAAFSK